MEIEKVWALHRHENGFKDFNRLFTIYLTMIDADDHCGCDLLFEFGNKRNVLD